MSTNGLWTMRIVIAVILLSAPAAPVSAATWSYGFDNDISEFSGTDGWVSQYCTDPWSTALNGGLTPKTDDGCNVEQCTPNNNCGYNWGYWLQGGQCIQSDPLDNHITFGPKTWEDYVFRADMRNDDDDTFGFVFRYQNSGQFYLFMLSRDIAPLPNLGCGHDLYGAALYRIEDSDGTVLGTAENVVYQPGHVHKVQITVQGDHITVEFDTNHDGAFGADETIFDLDDPDALPSGQVGFFAWENGATGGDSACSTGECWFDNAEVDVLAVDDSCDGISWEGYCEGSTAVYCDDGDINEVNCQGCCAWIPQQEYYWCTNGSLCQQDCIPECEQGDFGCSDQGTHSWVCQQDDTGCWIRSWTACSQTGVCDDVTGQCAGTPCEIQCVGDNGQVKQCGSDGCGGSCGTCAGDSYCGPDFTCVEDCVPNCESKICGSDGCGDVCGTCPGGFECNQLGMCQAECLPNCVGKLCGDDGCGGTCGLCPPGLTCVDYACISCTPDCEGKECGGDGCLGLCGTCPEGFTCEDNLCVEGPCEPQCVTDNGQEKQCGPDGCDGFCGFCPPDLECTDTGTCISTCTPDCGGMECGPDGCDGFCGQCDEDAICWDGQCITQDSCAGFCGEQAPNCYCDPECEDYGDCCDDVCDACPDLAFCGECMPSCADLLGNPYQCGDDGCGGACGVCDDDEICQGHICVPDGPIVPETCGEIQFCIDQCEGDDNCEGACFEAAPGDAQQLYFELVQCYQEAQEFCGCAGDDDDCWLLCLMEECSEIIDECHELEGDCDDIWGCVQGCQGDACIEDCLNTEGDAEAKLLFMELLFCVEDFCLEPYPGCYQDALEDECLDLLEECTGGACEPDCDGPDGPMQCGNDGCGGSCGECGDGFSCIDGECVDDGDPCEVACAGKDCGSTNGCLCGACDPGEACDDGECIPAGECVPGAYKKCVGDILYWFDSCDQQGPPTEICEVACVEDECVDEDPGTGDVIDPEDAGPDADNGGVTVFPKSEISSGCTTSPAGSTAAGWLLLLIPGALVGARRFRRGDLKDAHTTG